MEVQGLMLLRDLAKKLGVSERAVRQWVTEGRKSVGKKTVRMKSAKLPSGLASSNEYYLEFVRELSET